MDTGSLRVGVTYSMLSVSATDSSRVKCCCLGRRERVPVLDHVSGILKPGTVTLVIGPPGSGERACLDSERVAGVRPPSVQEKLPSCGQSRAATRPVATQTQSTDLPGALGSCTLE